MASCRSTTRLPCAREATWATLVLFTDVENAAALKQKAARGEIEAALLDPTHVSSYPASVVYSVLVL